MSGTLPGEIWRGTVDEGHRRLTRDASGLLATGVVGGVDVMMGILALTVATGAASIVLPEAVAHVVGSLAFGIGFVLIVIGRSELFTENFLVPVSAVMHRRARPSALLRLWFGTFLGNLVALAALAWILSRAGLVPPETLEAARTTAETLAVRTWDAALLSAIVAGTVMTLLTWLTHATDNDAARVVIALVIGFLLAAPSLNHAVVSFGEMAFGTLAGSDEAGWDDLAQNLPIAIAGNLIGGLGFVTLTRLVQVRGEPDEDDRHEAAADADDAVGSSS